MVTATASRYQLHELAAIATFIRRASIEATSAAGSGHPTSSMSCADILAALFFEVLRIDPERPKYLGNDRFILSKGHAAPALWATLRRRSASSRARRSKRSDISDCRSNLQRIRSSTTIRHEVQASYRLDLTDGFGIQRWRTWQMCFVLNQVSART